jgi:peptide-methionine (S)-S-oxide reductase
VKEETRKERDLEKATFGAGCFWGVEAAFRQIPGVVATRVGYTGGDVPDPTYELVCSHGTGHAEAVEVTFDPARVSYDDLLDVFWESHNPTTRDRQGLDIGSQYRSMIFYHSPEQRAAAERTKEEHQAKLHWPRKIVTEIVEAPEFYEAEDYHQQYLEKRGRSSSTGELAQASG